MGNLCTKKQLTFFVLGKKKKNNLLETGCLLRSMVQRMRWDPQGIGTLMERRALMPRPYKRLPMQLGMPA